MNTGLFATQDQMIEGLVEDIAKSVRQKIEADEVHDLHGLLSDIVNSVTQNFDELLFDKFETELEDGTDEDDGQPDEAQEWHDFDPDC